VLEQENDGGDWQLTSESRYQLWVDVWLTNVLEATGDIA
jgi:hypothetical protein